MTTVTGLPELKEALLAIPAKLRKKALGNALRAAGRVVRDDARARAPVLDASKRTARRKPGTLRNAISVRMSKVSRSNGDVGVFINVKPLPGAKFKTVKSRGFFGGVKKTRLMVKASQRGDDNPNDPYYWRWVEFGHRIVARFAGKYTDYRVRGRGRMTGLAARRRASTRSVPPHPFLRPAAQRLGDALGVFLKNIIPQIQKLNGGKDVQI
jgi:HK97 gp10 family phage protein